METNLVGKVLVFSCRGSLVDKTLMSGSEGLWDLRRSILTSYTDHQKTKWLLLMLKRMIFRPFSVLCRRVVVGSFFDFEFNKVQDVEKNLSRH